VDYLPRTIDGELAEILALLPAVALDGAKGVGKTASASRFATSSWFLDDQVRRALLATDHALLDSDSSTILLDEWQQLPEIWDVVRRQVDNGAEAGRFLLTGSASPPTSSGTHSGAGRIVSLRMRPMALYERRVQSTTMSLRALLAGTAPKVTGTSTVQLAQYAEQIVGSGFPGIFRHPARSQRLLLDAYLTRIIDRDLPGVGLNVRRPDTLRRWLAAYAAASSTTTSYSRILDASTAGDGTQPAKTTTITYRDHLTQLWLLDPVPGWNPTRNPLPRLQQAPKHQVADPALAARLLNISAESLLRPHGAAMAGPLFESLATLTVRVAAQAAEARVGHLRTRDGDHEVDLIVEGPEGQVLPIEVKLASSITDRDVRHLIWLRDRLPDEVVDLAVITAGPYAYRRRDGVAVIPLGLLGE